MLSSIWLTSSSRCSRMMLLEHLKFIRKQQIRLKDCLISMKLADALNLDGEKSLLRLKSSLSVFALHPLYLRVQALSNNIPEGIKKEIYQAKKDLDGKVVDYEATLATKLSIARKIFSLEKDQILASSSFQQFFSENEEWLKPYAAFCFLRDFCETSDHSQLGRFSNFSKDKLEKLVSKDTFHCDIICFHYYIQFHLYQQEKFGDCWSVIASNFLDEYQKNCYQFKDNCDTEKKVVAKQT